MERFARYLSHLTALGILDCRNAILAAHQFTGMLNEFVLWPWLMGRKRLPVAAEEVNAEATRMFLRRYRIQSRDEATA
jgi:TetR/AcrR family transcriptional regulator of autoinduction and epiphytic fitness